jgi:hypothetical protein
MTKPDLAPVQPVLISEALIAAYRAAKYWVDLPSGRIILAVGETVQCTEQFPPHTRLAVITACNPFSQPRSASDNASRQAELIRAVEEVGLSWFPAAGTDPKGVWDPEPSVGIIGGSDDQLDGWMERFEQNAVVSVELSGLTALRLHPRGVVIPAST